MWRPFHSPDETSCRECGHLYHLPTLLFFQFICLAICSIVYCSSSSYTPLCVLPIYLFLEDYLQLLCCPFVFTSPSPTPTLPSTNQYNLLILLAYLLYLLADSAGSLVAIKLSNPRPCSFSLFLTCMHACLTYFVFCPLLSKKLEIQKLIYNHMIMILSRLLACSLSSSSCCTCSMLSASLFTTNYPSHLLGKRPCRSAIFWSNFIDVLPPLLSSGLGSLTPTIYPCCVYICQYIDTLSSFHPSQVNG